MIVSFKSWFYKEESEDWYDSPDESLMQKILRNPISAQHMQDLSGELFLFKFPLSIEKIKVMTGSRITEKSPIGSLTAACLRYLNKKNYKELYNLLLKIKNNPSKKIANQILFHYNENA